MRLIKTLLVGTVLGLAALPALAKQDIVWWDFLSGGDGVRMKALIDAFNKEHPDIQVKGTTLEWGVPFYTKVRTASAVGEGPDVMTYHLSRAPLALQEKVLSEITDKDLEEAGLKKDDFFSAPLEAATHDGKLAFRFPIRHAQDLAHHRAGNLCRRNPDFGCDARRY